MKLRTMSPVLVVVAALLSSCMHQELTGSVAEPQLTLPGPVIPGTTTCYRSAKYSAAICLAAVKRADVVDPSNLLIPRVGKVIIVWMAPVNGYFDSSAGDKTNLTDPAFSDEGPTDDPEGGGNVAPTGKHTYLRIKFNFTAHQADPDSHYQYTIQVHTSTGTLTVDPTINNSAGLVE